jgi:hypothetical protein
MQAAIGVMHRFPASPNRTKPRPFTRRSNDWTKSFKQDRQ